MRALDGGAAREEAARRGRLRSGVTSLTRAVTDTVTLLAGLGLADPASQVRELRPRRPADSSRGVDLRPVPAPPMDDARRAVAAGGRRAGSGEARTAESR